MKKIVLILLLFILVGCDSTQQEIDWGDRDQDMYQLFYDSKTYDIYERIEYLPTPVSMLYPFSDTCGVVHDNDVNYLLYYEGELQSLSNGIAEKLYTGEELVELGVKGIHCN